MQPLWMSDCAILTKLWTWNVIPTYYNIDPAIVLRLDIRNTYDSTVQKCRSLFETFWAHCPTVVFRPQSHNYIRVIKTTVISMPAISWLQVITTNHIILAKFTCIHTYIYIYIYTHTCVRTYLRTCMHTYVHTHTHTHTHIHTYIHTYIHGYIRSYIRTYLLTCLLCLLCLLTYLLTYMHICIHAYNATNTLQKQCYKSSFQSKKSYIE